MKLFLTELRVMNNKLHSNEPQHLCKYNNYFFNFIIGNTLQ